jgi:cell division protein FtsQ
MDWSSLMPWRKRNRKRSAAAEAAPSEPLDVRSLAATLGALAIVAALAAVVHVALDRPVRRVLVEGAFQRVSPPEIESAVSEIVRGGLASVDLPTVRARIEKIDWVDSAVVTRQWPDAIRVVVVEQVAAARWNDTGLLNARGELFIRNARFVPPELPLLQGPDGSEGAVAQLYLDAQGQLLEAGLRLTGVSLDERGAWALQLGNGLVVRLGRQDVTGRLDRFIRLASPMVAKRAAEITYVDMRYTNGFSVGWNKSSALAVAPQEDATPDA